MSLPPGLDSISAIVCEKILQEADGPVSAIRIVDVFYFSVIPELPLERQPVQVCVVINGAIESQDVNDHAVSLDLLRPSGEVTALGEPYKGSFPSKIPGAPTGFTINAQVGVIPRNVGPHHLRVYFDGVLVTKARFTLLERSAQAV